MTYAALKNLSPGNFAFVMATGILSIIFLRTGWEGLAWVFLAIGSIGYLGLVSLFGVRAFVLGKGLLEDFGDIRKMFKYLTFSAGTNALATSFTLLGHNIPGLILGTIGVFSTILLTYTLFCALFFHTQSRIQVISPFWLLLAIACNSSGIVISTLWQNGAITHPLFLLFSFSFWTFGVFIYIILMTLNLYRMLFYRFEGPDMDPCYWTCMGAAAIAVVDGTRFILLPNSPPMFEAVKPFIHGMSLFLWCWGTAWIPILILMGLWKTFYFKVPFRYQPSLWAMVFPLGMYTDATILLSQSDDLDIQNVIIVLLWITFFVWCLVAFLSRLNPFAPDPHGVADDSCTTQCHDEDRKKGGKAWP